MNTISRNILSATAISLTLISAATMTACAVKQPQETVGQYVDGSVLTTTVKGNILSDKALEGTTISVKTYKDVVQLSGFVHTEAQKIRAEQVARSTEGVGKVDNAIIVKR
jgi:hyperosmotically inducible protein